MARNFTSDNHYVRCTGGQINVSGGVTIAYVCRSSDFATVRYPMSLYNTTSAFHVLYLQLSDAVGVRSVIQFTGRGTAVPFVMPDNTWLLIACSVHPGSAPRMHMYDYTAGTWTRADATSTATNLAGTVEHVYLGSRGTSDNALGGPLAVAGAWNRALTDAELDRLPYSLASWQSSRPSGLWLLDQTATTTPVLDLTGGGANQTAIVGTAVSTLSVPTWTYGHPILTATRDAVGGAVTISPDGIASTAAVGAPTLTPAAVTISPDAITSTAAVGAPTLTPAAVTLTPDGVPPASTVGAPTLIPAAVTVTPDPIDPASTVGAPTLTPAAATLTPESIISTSTVGAPALTVDGGAAISPDSIASVSAVGAPTVVVTRRVSRPNTGIVTRPYTGVITY